MQLRKFIKDYLVFTRKERLGLIVLIGLAAIIYFLPAVFKKNHPFPLEENAWLAGAIDTLENARDKVKVEEDRGFSAHYESSRKGFTNGFLFPFDPNVLPADGWKKLGLHEKAIKTIENYRNKGGKFYKTEDLRKIWGLPGGFYERVKEYIRIGDKVEDKNKVKEERKEYKENERKILLVNINEADTTLWIALPGIGSKLASRIVNFRDKLGGFYSIEQVRETFGLTDSTFQKIKVFLTVSGEVKKININTATKDELKTHPYIKWNLANAIVEYRNQHGNFKNVEDLRSVNLINEETIKKIAAYLLY